MSCRQTFAHGAQALDPLRTFPLWRSAARSIPLFNREPYDGNLGV
ncbi:MAG TPA: hypothetical protein VGE89_07340 [Bryobacteraceae bacterium]